MSECNVLRERKCSIWVILKWFELGIFRVLFRDLKCWIASWVLRWVFTRKLNHLWLNLLAVVCPKLTVPDKGGVIPASCSKADVEYGTRCVFYCGDGFELSGPRYTTCQDDTSWSEIASLTCVRGMLRWSIELYWTFLNLSLCTIIAYTANGKRQTWDSRLCFVEIIST